MANPATRRRLKGADLPGVLRRPLTANERAAVSADVRALVGWHVDLRRWRAPASAVDGVPYVALYLRGKLVGCFGSSSGEPAERLARAFLLSANDSRFGGVPDAGRRELACEVSYVTGAWPVDPARIESDFAPGVHGLAVVRTGGAPVVLLPSVARDSGYAARAMLDALIRKARVQDVARERFLAFTVDRVVVRSTDGTRRRPVAVSPLDAAAAWLAGLVDADGSVSFGMDARTGALLGPGEMHHARVAAAVQGLARGGDHEGAVRRARGWLLRCAEAAAAGRAVEGWPPDPAKAAGTLAHLVRAGVDTRGALLQAASDPAATRVPWHAAQIAAALGRDCPEPLVQVCVSALDAEPWSPWTVLALAALDVPDGRTRDALGRAIGALVASVRADGAFRGGVPQGRVPETAITALTVEALRSVPRTKDVRAAVARGQDFLRAWQILPGQASAAFDEEASAGAFLGSPLSSVLRADVTGHAVLALAPA